MIGTAIEWYDYFIFGTASALVFGQLFFPGGDPLIGTLSAFAVFGVGFFARPVGGIVFGHLGDKHGRKLRWSNKAKRRALAVMYPSGNPFLDLCMWKGRFPSRMAASWSWRSRLGA